ncbi:hypothetical protein BFN03_07885 [Rhodococcus sp. WMMA185]|uniref:class I SAM-dependent methyltransferase n=1 Tax=Rhodococcus sp. WMMA185 TaxID=679318 RepID=UPI000878D105|nr:class I SAM-dependent methyltransferase [Rhodococcus sp. WMMA185]AOW92638.1 hypothetical protein BFN03_07885 [Rhodococcus sp. WMMA185]
MSRFGNPFTDYLQSIGDRTDLYEAVADRIGARRVLYPGSYLDLAPSYVWPDVTYLDSDTRAHRAFTGTDAAISLARTRRKYEAEPRIEFIAGDYTDSLAALPRAQWDLALSLYAGPVSEHAARCLRPGGHLLVNNSHADAGLAHLDSGFELEAAVHCESGRFRVVTDGLDRYFQPKRPPHPTRELLRADGRGVRYTRPADVYLFRTKQNLPE